MLKRLLFLSLILITISLKEVSDVDYQFSHIRRNDHSDWCIKIVRWVYLKWLLISFHSLSSFMEIINKTNLVSQNVNFQKIVILSFNKVIWHVDKDGPCLKDYVLLDDNKNKLDGKYSFKFCYYSSFSIIRYFKF